MGPRHTGRYFIISTQNIWSIIRCVGCLKVHSIYIIVFSFPPHLYNYIATSTTAHNGCITGIAGDISEFLHNVWGIPRSANCSAGVHCPATDSVSYCSTSNTKVASQELVTKRTKVAYHEADTILCININPL